MRNAKAWRLAGPILVLIAMFASSGCRHLDQEARAVTGGDPARGPRAIRAYGCYGCHTIRGIPDAHGTIGPVLDHMSRRASSAGRPADVSARIQWIRDPQGIGGPTLMPDLGVTEQDARDIAAYLYTLR
jgi:cytochrome c